jgi:glutathione S-transferase
LSDPRIVLYGIHFTPFTQKVIRALRFKGLPFEYYEPSDPIELRRWSPETGQLPVIEIDGERIGDSEAILDALETRFPDPRLVSRDPKTAREQRQLSHWVGETFRFYLMRWLARHLGPQANGASYDEEGNALGPLARMGLISEQDRIRDEAFDTSREGLGAEFERRIEDLVTLLGDRDYFYSDSLSRADLAVFASLLTLHSDRFAGGRALLARYPNLVRFVERIGAETGGLDMKP